jgi:coenzyme F420-dependent glucose-6-phosphate dehydrogenase
MRFGIKLCSEERTAGELVEDAVGAEAAGFDLAAISDHFHPWIDAQGESPFVWSVLGGVATATERLEIGTAVTCPTTRMHPAIVAQAAATAASMMPGRFFLGVGTGERLNEHVTGEPWPRPDRRRAMLQEAVEVMRELWRGDAVVHRGEHYVVDGARLYSVPDAPPPVFVAAAGLASASLAGAVGDGMIGLGPDDELVSAFRERAGADAPAYAEVSVCWGDDPQQGLKTALARWPIVGLPGDLGAELPMPAHFEQAASLVRLDDVRGKVITGPDPQPYVDMVRRYADAGYDAVWFHQIGVDQPGFTEFFRDELRPALDAA